MKKLTQNRTCKTAFTLAEILITIAIVGTVSILTLPTLDRSIREQVTVNRVNKTYAMFSNALRLAIAENGSVDTWNIGDTKFGTSFMNIYKKYFKYAQDCGSSTNCIYSGTYKVFKNGKVDDYYNYSSHRQFYKIKLLDGGAMWVRANESSTCNNGDTGVKNVCALIWYDYNGKKSPNIIGEDVFVYFVLRESIIPHGGLNIADNCKDKKSGWACSAYLYKYKNMDYLH